jgi:hypothetical protein
MYPNSSSCPYGETCCPREGSSWPLTTVHLKDGDNGVQVRGRLTTTDDEVTLTTKSGRRYVFPREGVAYWIVEA